MPIAIYLFIFIELCFVAYLDFKYKKIKNIWSVLNLLIALILFFAYPDLYPFGIEMFQFTLVFLLVGFVLFMLKVMGGGDSKFLATVFLVIPLKQQDIVFYNLLISTIIIGGIVFVNNIIVYRRELYKSIKNMDVEGIKKCFGKKFPYAPVILLAWVWFGWTIMM